MICAKGGKKKLPSSYPCPCHPSGKRSGLLPLSLSLFSISSFDERGTMIAATTKGRAARVWMRQCFLLSFLPYYLSLLTLSDLPYSLFPLHYSPLPTPLSPSSSRSISHCLMPLAGVTPPFFVRASTIQSGDGIKNQKVSLSERHPGWCTLMSPWKFEIHMLSHFILVACSPRTLTFLLLFSPLLCLFSIKCHHVLFC